MSDNTIPPGTAIPLTHEFCPPDRPYPESYAAALAQDPTQCQATDPCSGDGESTLWTLQPCEATTTATVAVIDPPVLPRTGLDVSEPVFGAICVLFGVGMLLVSKRRPAK